MVLTW